MRKFQFKKHFIASFVGLITPLMAFGESNESQDIIYNSYREYLTASKDYISTQQQASEEVRNWRKKRLAEIFNEKLDGTEHNLLLSNANLIEEFNKFLKANGVDSLDDVLLIRLSQLYFEKANLEFNQVMKKNQESESSNEIPIPNYERAIYFSKLFISKFENSSIADKAYYLLGFASEEMGKPAQSISYYETLLKNYPSSEFGEEVAWRLAEIYYGNANYAKAEEMYQRLSKIQGHFFTKAMYKLGATYFTEKKIIDSSKVFQKLIEEISKLKTPSQEDQVILDESYEYLATLLSNNNKLQIATEYQPEVYYRLGLLYKKRLDEKSMRAVFAAAAQKFPKARQLPLFYSELIESYDGTLETEKENNYRNQFVQALIQDQKWWTENEDYKNIVFQTQDLLEFNLIKSAEYYADKGYAKENYDDLKIAKSRYFNFITKYPWSTYRDYAKLELADLEYYLSNYPQASTYYFEIVNEASSQTLREEAAYSLIWSEVKKTGYSLNFDEKTSTLQNAQKTALTAKEKIFADAALFYISKIRNSSRKNKVTYKLAEIYADHGDYDNAALYLNLIISDTENTNAVTVSAYRFLMEVYNIKNDWTSLSAATELYNSTFFSADIESLDKDNFRQKFRDKLETAYNFELEGKFLEAAQEFEKVLVQNPRSPMTDFLNLKIAGFYIQVGQYAKAKNICAQLMNTKYKVESQFLIAKILYLTAKIEDAANALEVFVLNNKKHPWFEEALINTISLRSQMNSTEKTIALIKKLNADTLSSYVFYDYIRALLSAKKYDDLYKVVNSTKGKNKYDSYRLQYFALKAQHDRYDYVGLERTCAGLEKALSNPSRAKTAFGTLNKSFCEYAKLKTIIGQSDLSLEEIVSKLNTIYSYKIDSVTTLALNEIIENSDLKNTYKVQFEQLIQKGWSIAKLHPFSEETKKLSDTILNYNGKLPISLSYLMNWKVGLSELFEFQSFKGSDVKQICESKQYTECLAGLKEILKTDKSKEVYENLIVASLKANDDEELQNWVSEYLKETSSDERSQIFANYLGMQDKIPDKKGISVSSDDPMALSAKAMEYWANKKYKEATDILLKSLSTNPESVYPYYALAEIYYDRGFPELARTIVTNGYGNSENKALLPLLYQLKAVTYSQASFATPQVRQDQSPAESFATAFSALKNKDNDPLDKSYKAVMGSKKWFDTIKALELVYTNSNGFKPDPKESNLYTQWLQELYKLSQGQEPFSLDKINTLAQKTQVLPNYKEIERVTSSREIAGDKK